MKNNNSEAIQEFNGHLQREQQGATKMFDDRSLTNDYSNLIALLKPVMNVLDLGCGTGSIFMTMKCKEKYKKYYD